MVGPSGARQLLSLVAAMLLLAAPAFADLRLDNSMSSNAANAVLPAARTKLGAAAGAGINVKTDYGAKCDGVTDDTAALQAAFTAAAATGITVALPAGVCLFTPPLAIAGTMHLIGTNTGAGALGSSLKEVSGSSANLLNVGYQTGETDYVTIENVAFLGNAPVGGYALSVHNAGRLTVNNISIQGTFCGIDEEQSNFDQYNNVWGNTVGTNCQAFYWYANPATVRADQLTLRNIGLNSQFNGNDGLVLDGFVQTLNAQNIIFLQSNHGFWIRNTAANGTKFPAFVSIHNLQAEGAKTSACEIDAGRYIYITDSFCNNNYGTAGQGNLDGAVLTILPDTGAGGSVTSDVHMENVQIGGGRVQTALIQGQGIYFSNMTFGASGLGTAGPNVEIAGSATTGSADYGFSNVKFCGKFGDTITGSTYGLQIDNYVSSVKVNGGNFNYCQTGAVDFTRDTAHYQFDMSGSSDTNGNPLPVSAGDYQSNATPTVSACGTAPTVSGNNLIGSVVVGTGTVTSCTITFAGTGVHSPNGGGPTNIIVTSNNTAIAVAPSGITATSFNLVSSASMPGVQVFWRASQGVN